ncbi:MAG: DNA polymerase III subunit delta [Gottschalkiaceae bacterium]|nr:DNA polymerase III subunit delta [Proteiniborus ethanoligenes]TAH62868.1 MAG: DNA polymerase III subunit delta [Gottschalkiaceae bacterium]
MSYKNVLKDIKDDNLKNLYLLFGSEMYLKDYILSNIKKKYIDEAFESLNYIHIDGKEANAASIINACETLPFMADKKIVVVEELTLLTSKKEESRLDEDELCKYLENINISTCLIFISSELKIDNRKKIIKIINKQGNIVELSKLKDLDLTKWTQSIFSKNKKNISMGNIQYFLQQVGYYDNNSERTLYDLENEINKICSYLGSENTVEKEDIEKVLVKSLQNDIFALVDALGQKKSDIALSIFNDMVLDNEPIPRIFPMIIRQLRLLVITKLCEEKGYGQGDISKKVGLPLFVTKKLILQTRNFTLNNLHKGIKVALDVDRSIKTGKMEGKLAIEMFITEFSS